MASYNITDWAILAFAAILGVLVAFVPIIWMHNKRTLELRILENAIIRFTKGDLNVRIPMSGGSACAHISKEFNLMADQYQQTHQRIIRLNTELEERVAYRTNQLRELANQDYLTGLSNRRHMQEMLQRYFENYEDPVCVAIDLDGFKGINDELGHAAGDEVLRICGATIKDSVDATALAARLGGDEFAVVFASFDANNIIALCEKIRKTFLDSVRQRFSTAQVGMSIGVAAKTSIAHPTPDSLLRAADQALYRAKSAGKNCTKVADPVRESRVGRVIDPTPPA